MEPYLVSFRRHRPDSFMSVVGQTHITQTLKNAIRTDKLAQAMLFCGPRGVGKTTCARILAKAINCLRPTEEAEACGVCASCASIRAGGSMAIYELDAASNNSVDDIRNLVEQVRYPPQGGKFKVYIIDEVHMLSTAAFNAFLKTLEEPPPYAIFILATTEKHKILPTILSRCQVYQFNRIRVPDIAGELERVCRTDGIPFEEQALYSLAEKADGALRDALSMLDQIVGFSGGQLRLEDVVKNLNLLDSRSFFDATNYILDGDLPALLLLLQKIIVEGFETDAFLAGLASHWRWLLLARDEQTRAMLEVGKDSLPSYVDQAGRLSLDIHLSGLNLLAQAEMNHRQSRNPRLHAEMALAKLCYARQLLLPPETDMPDSSEAALDKQVNLPDHQERASPEKKVVDSAHPVAAPSTTLHHLPSQSTTVATQDMKASEATRDERKTEATRDMKASEATRDERKTEATRDETMPLGFEKNQIWPDNTVPELPMVPAHKTVATPLKVSKIKSPQLHASQATPEHPLSKETGASTQISTSTEKDTIEQAWLKMLAGLQSEGRKYVHSALSQIKPVLNNAAEIEIPIEHDALRTALDVLLFDLTNQLRSLTGRPEIQLKLLTMSPDSQAATFATLSEKKQWLLDKYPQINPFIQRLGLDWSY
ncbi:MAG: DNA polymerase III subunit gamma/tau [Bacteroidetes bacterium]|nr:DNA polymerase III subunit gamma/tau [Bacteroidota bacterium]